MENHKPFSGKAVAHPKGEVYWHPVFVSLTQQIAGTANLLSKEDMIYNPKTKYHKLLQAPNHVLPGGKYGYNILTKHKLYHSN